MLNSFYKEKLTVQDVLNLFSSSQNFLLGATRGPKSEFSLITAKYSEISLHPTKLLLSPRPGHIHEERKELFSKYKPRILPR